MPASFESWDNLTLARWLAQTLGQLEAAPGGSRIRSSARIASARKIGHDRSVWLQRLATPPAAYAESPCCRAPFLPLLTRDVRAEGLICQHCNEILVPFDEIPAELREPRGRMGANNTNPSTPSRTGTTASAGAWGITMTLLKTPRKQAEQLLAVAGRELAPKMLGQLCRRDLGGPGRMSGSAARRRGGLKSGKRKGEKRKLRCGVSFPLSRFPLYRFNEAC